MISGARGCTPQSCGFRDHYAALIAAAATAVFGLSTQTTMYQTEVVARLHLPFALLSDAELALTNALNLPTFAASGMVLLSRLTLISRDGVMEHVMHQVDAPAENAAEVVAYLKRG